MKPIIEHLEQIKEACALNSVKQLFAFGSVTRNDLTEESDIDLMVSIDDPDPISYSEHYYDLKDKLEMLLRRKIDLLEEKAIRNPFLRKEIERTKVLVYGE